MIKVVDIVYHSHHEFKNPQEVLEKHKPTLGFIDFIKDRVSYTVIRHLNYAGKESINGTGYAFFKRTNAAWQIPFSTHRYIKSIDPDIVLVHGFIFPLQVIALKRLLGKKCAIVLQHHADQPARSARKIFQKIADRYVNAYLFSSEDISIPWLQHKIIHTKNKVVALAGASASIEKKDKASCKQKLGLTSNSNFLWVGRLNENKDPLTVLKAFQQHLPINPSAALFIIYQTEELLAPVKEFINKSECLHNHVHLIGKIPPAGLAEWYNAADFFISGSHAEAAGYALLEAMSVGCIPVVSCIPAYKKILNDGKTGFMFQPGDEQGLLKVLNRLVNIDINLYSARVETYFHQKLGFKNIADDMFNLFRQLHSVKR
ncbi:MAG: glycosyltransferase family 4 protein [Chitinophagaceae bacterium]